MPDNKPMTDEEHRQLSVAKNAKSTWSYRQLLTCPKFWFVSLGWAFYLLGACTILLVLVAFMMGNGMPYETVIKVASAMGIITCVVSWISGFFDTKFGVVKTSVVIVGLEIIGVLGLSIGGAKLSIPMMIALWIIFQGTAGCPNNLFSSQVLTMFGPKGYSTSYVLFSVFLALRNVATFISGVSLEKTGGYNAGGIVGGIIMIIGLILIIAAGGKKLPDPQSEETAVE